MPTLKNLIDAAEAAGWEARVCYRLDGTLATLPRLACG